VLLEAMRWLCWDPDAIDLVDHRPNMFLSA
jgi:hypothetical protein